MPDLNVGVTFPGELLIVKVIDAWITYRNTASKENLDKSDALMNESMARGDKFWSLLLGPLFRALEKMNERIGS